MRRPVIVANWKMYKTRREAQEFFGRFKPLVRDTTHCEIVVAPPFTSLSTACEAARGTNIAIAAQNAYWEQEGAFTGEISMHMLADCGCRAVILGHSERRCCFGETDAGVNRKVKAALAANLQPLVCVGETIEERDGKKTTQVLESQFRASLAGLTAKQFSRILIAYEPVWAIGTGRTATPELAAESHACLRRLAKETYGAEIASAVRVLYGGSVRPDNVAALMAQEEIDGALVGGASLDAESFASIVNF